MKKHKFMTFLKLTPSAAFVPFFLSANFLDTGNQQNRTIWADEEKTVNDYEFWKLKREEVWEKRIEGLTQSTSDEKIGGGDWKPKDGKIWVFVNSSNGETAYAVGEDAPAYDYKNIYNFENSNQFNVRYKSLNSDTAKILKAEPFPLSEKNIVFPKFTYILEKDVNVGELDYDQKIQRIKNIFQNLENLTFLERDVKILTLSNTWGAPHFVTTAWNVRVLASVYAFLFENQEWQNTVRNAEKIETGITFFNLTK
ncbi:hypothetical protein [Mycoplasmopsis columbinasalis]|uniref:Uncharacterized protein n=1 Tax=Mycoplasmopsis columbinasalis TaxID=114880 RepID=A0A449BB22_9BACT|nr:hypothetical protein [Mycoplasmopsis columbinasalis]VEU78390.1 Uncharacterised protein [Mycoplasmopsis columbinasalis]